MSLNPWVALILGVLIGWLLEWLLELWFFRRRRLECQQRLSKVEADLQVRDAELRNVRAQSGLLEADLRALRAEAPVAAVAEAELPISDFDRLSARVAASEVELPKVVLPDVDLPDVDLPKAGLPDVELPEVKFPDGELPKVELPDVEFDALKGKVAGGAAAVGGLVAGLVGKLGSEAEGPAVELPQVALPDVALPRIEAELPAVELPQVALPDVELPQVALPDVALPRIEAELPAVELPQVALPEVELPQVALPDVALPRIEAELPAVELPQVALPDVELPEVEFGALEGKIAGGLTAAGLAAGLAGKLEGEVEAPEIEVAVPDVEIKAPSAEVDWPDVSAQVAEVAVELPEVRGPHIGAELPTGGVELPEAALEALAPSTELHFEVDDLTLVPGIGPKYAAQLSAAGITTYAALSATQPKQLKAIINAPEWRRVDYDAWVTGAQTLASQPRVQRAGDDLTLLEGIGPVYAAKLNEAGIMTFADLAAADEAGLSDTIQAPAWRRVNYGDWIAQARLAAAGDHAGLQALQAALFSHQGDNIGLVSGVGEKTAQALSAAGITTFNALAAASPEQLAQITHASGVREGDFSAWIEEAKLRAAGKRITRAPRARSAKTVSCPQDLSRVKGIGSVYEQKLYAAGIGTFWELAHSDDAALADIFELKEFQDVDLTAIKSDALRLAEETSTTGRKWDGTLPDDFEPFEGIGEVYEGRLYDAGICTYRALAGATVEQLAEICHAPEWRKPDYASWIAQAKRLLGQEA